MNSRGGKESPWKIPRVIATVPKFWLFEVSSTFQRGMSCCKRFLTLLDILNMVRHYMIQEYGTTSIIYSADRIQLFN